MPDPTPEEEAAAEAARAADEEAAQVAIARFNADMLSAAGAPPA